MRATVRVDAASPIGAVSPLIYGQYVEHVADCVYPGIWVDPAAGDDPALRDEDSGHAEEHGFRADVLEAAREAHVPLVRWPGGCFADVYHWRDGVGPREQRPVRRNWHWGGTESNSFGTDEFLTWCEQVGAAPYITVNLGTGGLDEALRWVDYCNGTEPTADVQRRRASGRDEPYGVRLWGIGNETWGAWEAGHLGAEDYARELANWARFLTGYDPAASVVAVGSCEGREPGWDEVVLETAGGHVEHLSIHLYGCSTEPRSTEPRSTDDSDGEQYLRVAFTPVYFETRMRAMLARIRRRSDEIRLALDEWNIRHYRSDDGGYALDRASPRTLQDAVFAGGVLNALIRLGPDVSMANHVFLVNGNAILNTCGEQLVRTPLYHLFRQYRAWMRGTALPTEVDGPTVATPTPLAEDPDHEPETGDLPPRSSYVDAAATRDEDGGVSIALINRHPEEAVRVSLELPEGCHPRTAWTLSHDVVHAANDRENPDRVTPRVNGFTGGTRTCPPHSVTLVRCGADEPA